MNEKYRVNPDSVRKRTKVEKSNIALRGEAARHKRKIKLPKLKFLEKKDEEPTRA
jgi:hypothetical protein